MPDRTASLRALLAEATPVPWFRQGALINGPDRGGIDVGPLRADVYDPDDAALIVAVVNALPLLLDVVDTARDVALQEGRHRLGPSFATVPAGALAALRAALRALDGEGT